MNVYFLHKMNGDHVAFPVSDQLHKADTNCFTLISEMSVLNNKTASSLKN